MSELSELWIAREALKDPGLRGGVTWVGRICIDHLDTIIDALEKAEARKLRANCATLPNGDCVGTGCMHDPKPKKPINEVIDENERLQVLRVLLDYPDDYVSDIAALAFGQ